MGTVVDGVPAGLFPIGNVSKLSLAVSEETKELVDYRSPTGGLQSKITQIKSVEAAITAHDLSPDNVALALRGAATAITSASVTNEQHTAYSNAFVDLSFVPDLTQTITVKNSAEDTTYVLDTDYTVDNSGIVILSGGAISDASTIKVSYTKAAANSIEGLVNSGLEYRMVFNGLNTARGGKLVTLTLYRVVFSPTSGFDFIGDDLNKIEMKASVLSDSTIVGAGLSQYMKIKLQN